MKSSRHSALSLINIEPPSKRPLELARPKSPQHRPNQAKKPVNSEKDCWWLVRKVGDEAVIGGFKPPRRKLARREPINSEWSVDVRFGSNSRLKPDIATCP